MRTFNKETISQNRKYLQLLAEKFPGIRRTTAEIINLNAILNLPKGTEHFISDIHGEFEAFEHVLRNCSGSIRRKVIETFQFDDKCDENLRLSDEESTEFCTLIYYPAEKLKLLKQAKKVDQKWYELTILRLIKLSRLMSRKYSHSKIRNSFPENYAYIIQELLFKSDINGDRNNYYDQIIKSIIDTEAADDFIVNICATIRRLCLDHLHIIGDIFDRGVGPQHVMDTLMNYHTVDIQWGNHDILWIGAAAGNLACIANAVRICMRYGNTSVLEDGYGINLLPLTLLAIQVYGDDEALGDFMPKISDEIPDIDDMLLARMQKAIAVIQFKLESQLIRRNPLYNMQNRMLIDTIDLDDYTVEIDGVKYPLNSGFFPTIDPKDPSKLTKNEEKVVRSLHASFTMSEKLQKHISFMLSKGSIYLVYNNNLLIHAGVPMNDDLSFRRVNIDGREYSGKQLLDVLDEKIRKAYYVQQDEHKDIYWYLWCSPESPLFGKDKMATFERYFIEDKNAHKERTLAFYSQIDKKELAEVLFEEFGISADGHIICGHVPVKAVKGENPIKAEGSILCIDAGFSKAYQKETGMAGCTLTFNSYGMTLVIHEPFESIENAIVTGRDIISESRFVNNVKKRLLVSDTNNGEKIKEQIYYLEMLLFAYRTGEIKPV